MHAEQQMVTGNFQVMRKLTEFAKMCCTYNTSPMLALQTSVMAVMLLALVSSVDVSSVVVQLTKQVICLQKTNASEKSQLSIS